jgi:enoyl-CoA hydratase
MAAEPGHAVLERRGSTLLVVLDRPEARNAMNRATRRQLIKLMAEADADPEVRAVVLTGRDPAFSAGVDLKETLNDPHYRPPPNNPAQALRAMRTPVIAAVNGACVSGALEVALACSYVLASDRAKFADTHARIGLIPSWGLSAALPQAVGVRRARQMTLTGDFVDPQTALVWGLVNEVVPHDGLLDRALGLAASMAEVPEHATRAVLSLYSRGEGASLATALGLEAETHALWKVENTGAKERFAATIARGSS